MDEDDHMDEDWEDGSTLFDEGDESHSSTSGPHRQKGDNSDASCGPGEKGLLALNLKASLRITKNWYHFYRNLYKKLAHNLHHFVKVLLKENIIMFYVDVNQCWW